MDPSCYSPAGLFQYFFTPEQLSLSCRVALESASASDSILSFRYLFTFVLTCVLEAPFYWFLLRTQKPVRQLLALFACNLVTHPVIYFLFPRAGGALDFNYAEVLLAAELFAPALEAVLLKKLWRVPTWSRAILLITAANIFSWWLGIYLV